MAWTYSGDPSTSDKDMVRFLIGDTISTDPLLQDEEINSILAIESDVFIAAAKCAEAIAAKYSRLADTKVGKTSVSYSQKAERYMVLATNLRKQKSQDAHPIPYAGGISKSDKETQETDTDRVEPFFERDQFKNPGTEPVNLSKYEDDYY